MNKTGKKYYGKAQGMMIVCLLAAGLLLLTNAAFGQEKLPGFQEKESDQAEETGYVNTWEMPEITVYGSKPLKEEQFVGSYGQPRWTTRRRFPTTRVYVVPEGKLEFEWWTCVEAPRLGSNEDGHSEQYFYEVEMGLPHRFQLDLYMVFEDEGGDRPFEFSEQSVELRWAMADWGKIWGNPTLYAEYTERSNNPDKEELKLLLGDELAERWHWGVNLVREWTVNDPELRETENEITGGISYTVKDSVFSAGLEVKMSKESEIQGTSREWYQTLKVGPSIQWSPEPQMNIQFAPLFGIGDDSEKYQAWLIVGWEF